MSLTISTPLLAKAKATFDLPQSEADNMSFTQLTGGSAAKAVVLAIASFEKILGTIGSKVIGNTKWTEMAEEAAANMSSSIDAINKPFIPEVKTTGWWICKKTEIIEGPTISSHIKSKYGVVKAKEYVKKNKKIIVGGVSLVAAAIMLYYLSRSQSLSTEGGATTKIEAVSGQGSSNTFTNLEEGSGTESTSHRISESEAVKKGQICFSSVGFPLKEFQSICNGPNSGTTGSGQGFSNTFTNLEEGSGTQSTSHGIPESGAAKEGPNSGFFERMYTLVGEHKWYVILSVFVASLLLRKKTCQRSEQLLSDHRNLEASECFKENKSLEAFRYLHNFFNFIYDEKSQEEALQNIAEALHTSIDQGPPLGYHFPGWLLEMLCSLSGKEVDAIKVDGFTEATTMKLARALAKSESIPTSRNSFLGIKDEILNQQLKNILKGEVLEDGLRERMEVWGFDTHYFNEKIIRSVATICVKLKEKLDLEQKKWDDIIHNKLGEIKGKIGAKIDPGDLKAAFSSTKNKELYNFMIQWIDHGVKFQETEELGKLVWAMTGSKELQPNTTLSLNGYEYRSSQEEEDSTDSTPSFNQYNKALNFPIPEEMTELNYEWFSLKLEKSLDLFYERVAPFGKNLTLLWNSPSDLEEKFIDN